MAVPSHWENLELAEMPWPAPTKARCHMDRWHIDFSWQVSRHQIPNLNCPLLIMSNPGLLFYGDWPQTLWKQQKCCYCRDSMVQCALQPFALETSLGGVIQAYRGGIAFFQLQTIQVTTLSHVASCEGYCPIRIKRENILIIWLL